ncbi:hypothetical protein [Streptomyces sp. NBC_01518]|uniref:hypothetical protein n=1 Tax=Streptomyces sp. NBC_01518 TaxID=2903891 RepID=UPI0038649DC0
MHRLLEPRAKRIFETLAGGTGCGRDLSEEALSVVLKDVGAGQQDGYVRQVWGRSSGQT